MGSIRKKNNWNNASKRLFGSYSHSGIPGFRSGYSAPRSRIAGIYPGIHSYSGIFPNERALSQLEFRTVLLVLFTRLIKTLKLETRINNSGSSKLFGFVKV